MKVAIVSSWREICGISTYNLYFTNELQKLNPDIFILAENRAAGGPDDGQISSLPNEQCWNRYLGFSPADNLRGVLEVIEEKKPDIVHWSHEFGLFCLTPKTTAEYINLLEKINQLGIKQTVTYHSVPVNGNNFFREYYGMSSPFFEKIVAHTKEQMDKLIEYKVPQSRLSYINHGVLLCPLYDKEEARKKLGIPLNKKVVMSMGFFGGLKGVEDLINIHSDILKTDPNVLFYFVGGLHYATAAYGRSYMKDCFRSIINKGLRNKFTITGFVPEDMLPWYYAASDVSVLNYYPSGYMSPSGCSAKLTASKRLIITTDGTHRNDELENGKECIKVHYSDMDKMRQVITNSFEQDYSPIIKNAYDYAQENSWANISQRYMDNVFSI